MHDTVSLHHVVFFFTITCRHLLGVSFVTSCKSNLRTAVTTENTEENKCMISPAQNTTQLQFHVYLTELYGLFAGPSSRAV